MPAPRCRFFVSVKTCRVGISTNKNLNGKKGMANSLGNIRVTGERKVVKEDFSVLDSVLRNLCIYNLINRHAISP